MLSFLVPLTKIFLMRKVRFQVTTSLLPVSDVRRSKFANIPKLHVHMTSQKVMLAVK